MAPTESAARWHGLVNGRRGSAASRVQNRCPMLAEPRPAAPDEPASLGAAATIVPGEQLQRPR